MKKFLFLIAVAFSLFVATPKVQAQNSNTARWGNTNWVKMTAGVLPYNYLQLATTTGTVSLTGTFLTGQYNFVKFTQPLTGAMTIVSNIVSTYSGDQLHFVFSGGGANYGVSFSSTLGTNMFTTSTLTVTSGKFANISFISDGVRYLEKSRWVQP